MLDLTKRLLILLFYLEDAFGSIPHSLIEHTLQWNLLPEKNMHLFSELYRSSQTITLTHSWRSEPYSFCRGVFQGDPLLPTIFLLAFNPVLQQIKLEEELIGYKIHTEKSTSSIVTLPYADDFCLVTTNMRTHQKYINKINTNIKSMGMKLKPSKCRSFSICSGKAKHVSFCIDDNQIPSICKEDQKFLGKLLFFSGKSERFF